MMDFSFIDGTESAALEILGIGPRATGGGPMKDFDLGDGTDANALRLLSIGPSKGGSSR